MTAPGSGSGPGSGTGTGPARDILRAARGASVLRALATGDGDAADLAYVALYACGLVDGRDLAPYRALGELGRHDAFVAGLHREVGDTVRVGGWRVTGHDGPRVLVARDGMRAYVRRPELVPAGSRPAVGDRVSFTAPALRSSMPGFVARPGERPLGDRGALSRLYLTIRSSAAGWALGPLARSLDAAGLPYEMKVLAHPRAYIRRDPCVVYVRTADEARAIDLVARELDRFGPAAVRPGAPRLAGRVAPGLNLAHEPTDVSDGTLSHGQWVAGLFLEASRSTVDPPAIAARVRELIAAAGRDPGRPHRRGTGPVG